MTDVATWIIGGAVVGFAGLLGVAASATPSGALNGLAGYWAGTWVALTPDTYGYLFAKLRYPDQDEGYRRLSDEWFWAVDAYQRMIHVQEAGPRERVGALALGSTDRTEELWRGLYRAVKGGRPREVLTEGERRAVRDFLTAFDAYRRLAKVTDSGRDDEAWTKAWDWAVVLAMPEERVVAPIEKLLRDDIVVMQGSLAHFRQRPVQLTVKLEANLAQRVDELQHLQLRGEFKAMLIVRVT